MGSLKLPRGFTAKDFKSFADEAFEKMNTSTYEEEDIERYNDAHVFYLCKENDTRIVRMNDGTCFMQIHTTKTVLGIYGIYRSTDAISFTPPYTWEIQYTPDSKNIYHKVYQHQLILTADNTGFEDIPAKL